ncbi:MAG TPA: ATP-binding protein [Gemmatimonadales bacterium]|nr:ATP-binding protein [Gemmatimonadales bacterium]
MKAGPGGGGTARRYLIAGAALGVVLLHPVMEAVYWFSSHDRLVSESGSLWQSIAGRFLQAFTPSMLPMTGLFAFLGGAIGLGFWLYSSRHGQARGTGTWRGNEPDRDLSAVLSAGEGEHLEFKSHARWDAQLGRMNRALEEAVARTVAGFLNHEGGTLLIGVTDAGDIVGLQADYQTLKRRDRDGFQQFLMSLVQSKLGGHVCAQVHVEFCDVRGRDVCWVTVEPSAAPVYYQDGPVARYFVRTGNGTRELDVREALVHVARRRTASGPHKPDSG